jgi:hypothetical protein
VVLVADLLTVQGARYRLILRAKSHRAVALRGTALSVQVGAVRKLLAVVEVVGVSLAVIHKH